MDSTSKGSGGAIGGMRPGGMNLATSLSPSAAGGAGGAVDQQFKDDVNRRFEENGDAMEELKELCDELKKEIGHVRNDVAAKFANE